MKNLNKEQLRTAIQDEYRLLAVNPKQEFHFTNGRKLLSTLGYDMAIMEDIPEEVIASFAGVGNPFAIGPIQRGEKILDLGSGAGIDSLIAAILTGEKGHVTGVDMTEEMILKAQHNAALMGLNNVDFIKGFIEDLPVESRSIDVVISNGVINLSPDKEAIFNEIFRVLKPGGRIQIADVLLDSPVKESSKDLVHLWTTCVAGGELHSHYMEMMESAGFWSVNILEGYDVFRDAPVESSALSFGAKGYNIRAFKPYLSQIMWNSTYKKKQHSLIK